MQSKRFNLSFVLPTLVAQNGLHFAIGRTVHTKTISVSSYGVALQSRIT